jgi:hypothetical protein
LIKDLLEVRIRPLILEAEVAVMMIRLYHESGDESYQVQSAISYYQQQFAKACDQIDRITEIKTVSLAEQVKIQLESSYLDSWFLELTPIYDKILLIDNYDSFTYNLSQCLSVLKLEHQPLKLRLFVR